MGVLGGIASLGCLLGSATLPSLGWSMGTPPFAADVRSAWGPSTKQSLEAKGCLAREETIEASARYRNLKSREPIPDKAITATLSFPGKDAKGSRLIPVWYTLRTDANGQSDFSISIPQALEELQKTLKQDRGYRGVKRTRGRVNLSFSSEETLQKSIRYVPARGFNFRICK